MRLSYLPVVALASMLPVLALACRDYAPSHERRPAKLEVYDRTGGHTLPIYMHDGRMYVAGEPGHQYELRLSNRSDQRVLAVTSVDGVNVISGETAESQQSGYVLDPWADLSVDGWRKSMDEVATFYFTRLSKSYAARTGRPHDVGVIGVAVFREQGYRCRDHYLEERADAAPEAPLANAEARTRRSLRPLPPTSPGKTRHRPRPPRNLPRPIRRLPARRQHPRRNHRHLLRLTQEPGRPRRDPRAPTLRG